VDLLVAAGSAAAGFIVAAALWWPRRRTREDSQYRTLVENSPTGVVVVDRSRVVFANRRLLLTVARGDESRVVGKPLADLLDPATLIDAEHAIARVMGSGEPVFLPDYLARGRDGVEARCDVRMVPVVFDRRPAVQISFILVEDRSRIVAALRSTEERFRRFFDEMPVPMYRTRPDGEIVHANKALATMLGVSDPADLIGVNAAVYYGEEGERDRLAKLQTEHGLLEDHLSLLVGADGRKIYVRDSSRTVTDGDSQVFEGVLIDVTAGHLAAQELEKRIRQQQAVAEIGLAALKSTDLAALLERAANRIRETLDVEATIVALAVDERRLDAPHIARCPGNGRRCEQVERYLTEYAGNALGAPAPIALPSLPAVADGPALHGIAVPIAGSTKPLGVIAVGGDEGVGLTAEDESFLASAAATLGSAVELARGRDQLEALIRSKDEFVASVSHELRTPLTVVAGLALELENGWRKFSPPEIAEFVELIADQSREMGDLIEDLLVAARADIGKVSMHPEPVDVGELVDQVVATLALADRARVMVDGVTAIAVCDPMRCRQVIRNLLTNAVRYGGPAIRISVASDADRVRVVVFDDGVGIPEEFRDAIFEAYGRAHPARGVPGSVGLGLTVSRKLARLMNGSIDYRYDDGSVFELTLPAASAPNEVAMPRPSRS
jgi:PAS domain S-box-containing protein